MVIKESEVHLGYPRLEYMAHQSQRITLKEASALSGYHPDYLSALIRSGKLWGEKVGKTWVTTRDHLNKYVLECGVSTRDTARSGSVRTARSLSLGVPGVALLVAVISLVAFITYVSVSGNIAVSRTSLSSSDAFDRSDQVAVPFITTDESMSN